MIDIDHKSGFNADSLAKWTDFTRRICYFNHQGNATLFQSLLPSDSALRLHIKRGEYIMKMVCETAAVSDLHTFLYEGWISENNTITVQWEDNQSKEVK